MGGEKLVSYLDTFSGIQLVMDELNAIECGFLMIVYRIAKKEYSSTPLCFNPSKECRLSAIIS